MSFFDRHQKKKKKKSDKRKDKLDYTKIRNFLCYNYYFYQENEDNSLNGKIFA